MALPAHPDPKRRACGGFVAKHGWLWAIFSDQGRINAAKPELPLFMTIARTADGENWDDLLQIMPGPDVHPVNTAPRFLVADNGDLSDWCKETTPFTC